MSQTIPPVIGGRYRVIRELGRGGMGAVYLVEHVHTGEHLALKVLLAHAGAKPEIIERFKREARAPARIRSDHVVRVTDADVAPELGGAPFMVMEALDGYDLEAAIQKRGALPVAEVAWILTQVASALDKAHALGIVHRDLKPENLYLHRRDDGSVIAKILDFGISRMQDGEPGTGQAGLTQTGAMMGTPLYMSPEQAKGNARQIGPATDVWALGLVALYLLTGQVYWRADSIAELMVQILAAPMEPPSKRFPNLGVAFDDWFARSCNRDPAARFASSGEQIRALAAVLGVPSILPPPSTSPARVAEGSLVHQSGAEQTASPPMGLSTASGSALARSGPGDTVAPKRSRLPALFVGAGVAVAAAAIGALVVPAMGSRTAAVGGASSNAFAAPPTPSSPVASSALAAPDARILDVPAIGADAGPVAVTSPSAAESPKTRPSVTTKANQTTRPGAVKPEATPAPATTSSGRYNPVAP